MIRTTLRVLLEAVCLFIEKASFAARLFSWNMNRLYGMNHLSSGGRFDFGFAIFAFEFYSHIRC